MKKSRGSGPCTTRLPKVTSSQVIMNEWCACRKSLVSRNWRKHDMSTIISASANKRNEDTGHRSKQMPSPSLSSSFLAISKLKQLAWRTNKVSNYESRHEILRGHGGELVNHAVCIANSMAALNGVWHGINNCNARHHVLWSCVWWWNHIEDLVLQTRAEKLVLCFSCEKNKRIGIRISGLLVKLEWKKNHNNNNDIRSRRREDKTTVAGERISTTLDCSLERKGAKPTRANTIGRADSVLSPKQTTNVKGTTMSHKKAKN